MIKKEREQVFRDPIHGYITVSYEIITEIIDTQVFQRLRRIRQLSGVSMVYHGAEHSRFSHSLGVYHNANRFLEVPDLRNTLTEREKLLFLSAALLHDVGHGPYSHAFEDIFGVDHEKIGARIIVENKELRNVLNKVDADFALDIASIILKQGKFPLLEQLISSQLDVDRLDYLLRDAYFTGTAYGNIDIDRLIRVMRIKNGQVVFKVSGIHAIENYLISRYHMYWQVYYHNVSRAYEVILEKTYLRIKDLLEEGYKFKADVSALKEVINNPNNLDYYVLIDDFYINGLLASFLNAKDEILKTLSSDFLNRNIWGYLDVNSKNEEKISEIKNNMSDTERRYFTESRTVYQSTYKDEATKLGDKIYILLEDGSVKTLFEESKMIESLSQSGSKLDLKFFYRKK
ncbi:HD domain-containing protein [Haploplasma axanthum]|nr:HD domain-containing protein [Haploplasma axanthum]